MATVFEGLDALKKAAGTHLGKSEWLVIEQKRIDTFADATGDHQWIHVDAERAKSGPFGATIAHGFLTLALIANFLPQIIDVRGISMGINYGLEKVRFPNPVRVGSRVRASADLATVEDVKGGVQAKIVITLEIEGQEKPACVAEKLVRYMA
jgi:acyl dehydratase